MSWWPWKRTEKEPPISTVTWSGRTEVDTDLLIRDPHVRALLDRIDSRIDDMRQRHQRGGAPDPVVVPTAK